MRGETEREKESEGDGKNGAECGIGMRRNGRWMEGRDGRNESQRRE